VLFCFAWFVEGYLQQPPAPPSLFKNFSKNGLCDRYFVKQNILFDPSLRFLKEWGFGGKENFFQKV